MGDLKQQKRQRSLLGLLCDLAVVDGVLLEGRAELVNEARLFFGVITVNYMSEVWGDCSGY